MFAYRYNRPVEDNFATRRQVRRLDDALWFHYKGMDKLAMEYLVRAISVAVPADKEEDKK